LRNKGGGDSGQNKATPKVASRVRAISTKATACSQLLSASSLGCAPVPATPRQALQWGQTKAFPSKRVPHSRQITDPIELPLIVCCADFVLTPDFA
jgi:hypothetical protein